MQDAAADAHHEGVMMRRALTLLLVVGCAGCNDPYLTGPNSLYAAVFGPRSSKPTPAPSQGPSSMPAPMQASVSTSVTSNTVISGNTVVQQTQVQQTVVQQNNGAAPVVSTPAPVLTPRPTQKPVSYEGTGGRGLFGPFYLEAGIQRVKYIFKAKVQNEYKHHYFEAHLVGAEGSNFSKEIVDESIMTCSCSKDSEDTADDFNNIQVPYSGNYWIDIKNAEGDWQFNIELVSPSEVPGVWELNLAVQMMGANNSSGAEQQLKSAIQKNPDLGEAHVNLGKLHYGAGRLQDARREILTALTVFQRTQKTVARDKTLAQILANCHFILGGISCREGNAAEAKKELDEALRHDPSDETIRAAVNSLGSQGCKLGG